MILFHRVEYDAVKDELKNLQYSGNYPAFLLKTAKDRIMSTILINSVLYYSMAYKLKLKSMEKTLKNNPKNTERENL